LLLDHVNKGAMSLERFVDLTAHGPQRIFGIASKGRIARGYDADFTIVDMNLTRAIENKWIASRCGWTPFDGMKTKGWAVAAVLGGRFVMRDFALTGNATGKPLRFVEALASPQQARP
jgi:dihydroorotase